MTLEPLFDRGAFRIRVAVLALLFGAPLAFGATVPPAYIPLLAVGALLGLVSWARGHQRRTLGEELPDLPGRPLLLAIHALVVVQLVPLPPPVLRLLSPGSHAFWEHLTLTPPLASWRPISVSPAATAQALCFLAGLSLLAGAVYREFDERVWRRRLLWTVVLAGLALTVVAFVQAVSADPKLMYGLVRPRWDWAVFGPYANRSHFAGYLVMAVPLAMGFSLEALSRLRKAVERRRRGWLALGGHEGNAAVRRTAEVMVLVAGLFASRSRGGVTAFVVALLVLPLVSRRRRVLTALAVFALAGLGVAWIGVHDILRGFETRGIQASRLDLWRDAARLFPDFPLFGCGLGAFATAYRRQQTFWPVDWVGEAHNEYLQVLLDLGLLGFVPFAVLLVLVFRAAFRGAAHGPLHLGLLGALLGLAVHNVVDFNWQVPANAATWAALAALALRGDHGEGAHTGSGEPTHAVP